MERQRRAPKRRRCLKTRNEVRECQVPSTFKHVVTCGLCVCVSPLDTLIHHSATKKYEFHDTLNCEFLGNPVLFLAHRACLSYSASHPSRSIPAMHLRFLGVGLNLRRSWSAQLGVCANISGWDSRARACVCVCLIPRSSAGCSECGPRSRTQRILYEAPEHSTVPSIGASRIGSARSLAKRLRKRASGLLRIFSTALERLISGYRGLRSLGLMKPNTLNEQKRQPRSVLKADAGEQKKHGKHGARTLLKDS